MFFHPFDSKMESAIDMYWFHNDTSTVVTQILRDLDEKRKLAIVLELTEPAFSFPRPRATDLLCFGAAAR